MRKFQRGFSLFELLIVVAFLASLSIGSVALFMAWHFIVKFW